MRERTEVAPETVTFARETLLGDVRDMALRHIKSAVVWQAWSEQQQQDVIDSVSKGAETLLERVCSIMASDGKDTIHAQIEKLAVKDSIITLTLKCILNERNLTVLGLHQGGEVHLVYKDDASYSGTRGPVYADPDQPALPFKTENEGLGSLDPSVKPPTDSENPEAPRADAISLPTVERICKSCARRHHSDCTGPCDCPRCHAKDSAFAQ